MAVLTITDGGTKVDRIARAETLAIRATKENAASFSKTIAARPGCTIVEVVQAKAEVAGVKNLKVAVAADKKSATVSGEWAVPGAGKPGSADALIPLKLTEDRASSRPPSRMNATAILPFANGKANAAIPLPPLPPNLDGISRTIDVEIRQAGAGGKAYVIAAGPLVGRGAVVIPAKQIYSPPTPATTTAIYEIDTVKIAFEIGTSTVGRVN